MHTHARVCVCVYIYKIQSFKIMLCCIKGKAIPLQAWTGPEVQGGSGSQISRQLACEGGKVVSPTHRPPLPPRKYSWYSFLLEDESTPGL